MFSKRNHMFRGELKLWKPCSKIINSCWSANFPEQLLLICKYYRGLALASAVFVMVLYSYRVVAGGLLAVGDEFPLSPGVDPPEAASGPPLGPLSLQKTVVPLTAVIHLQYRVDSFLRTAASEGFAATTVGCVGTAGGRSLTVWHLRAGLGGAALY